MEVSQKYERPGFSQDTILPWRAMCKDAACSSIKSVGLVNAEFEVAGQRGQTIWQASLRVGGGRDSPCLKISRALLAVPQGGAR